MKQRTGWVSTKLKGKTKSLKGALAGLDHISLMRFAKSPDKKTSEKTGHVVTSKICDFAHKYSHHNAMKRNMQLVFFPIQHMHHR